MSNLNDDELMRAAMGGFDDQPSLPNPKPIVSPGPPVPPKPPVPPAPPVGGVTHIDPPIPPINNKNKFKALPIAIIALIVIASATLVGVMFHSNIDSNDNVSDNNYDTFFSNGDEAEYYEASSLVVGDYLELGEYPKTQVTDTRLIAYLDEQSVEMKSYSCETGREDREITTYYYGDFEYDGIKYRRVYYESQYGDGEKLEARGISDKFDANKNYYFQWEPLLWDIIGEVDGNWQLLAQNVIDGKPIDNNSNCWANSFCREWTSNTFINEAFTDDEKALIQITDTSETGYSSQDQVYLLSYDDITNGYFGFSSDEHDPSRETIATDYGAFYAQWDAYDHLNNIENCEYCLRTIEDISEEWGADYYQISDNGEGYIDHISGDYMDHGNGFRPALRISKNAQIPI